MYTMEQLTAINQRFINEHWRLTESDLQKANRYVDLIESTRDNKEPKSGDVVKYTDKYGEHYAAAHIEKIFTDENNAERAYICQCPSVPFVAADEEEVYCSTSGGAWEELPMEKLKYIGTQKKLFTDWGHCGACANGAIQFEANVSVWEYIAEGNPFINETTGKYYTTENFNNYYIHHVENAERYKYKAIIESKAWENEIDLQAWLRTFRGKVFKGGKNQIIVWTWKHQEHHVSPDEFNAIDGIEDSLYCNGLLRCKRVYDETNCIVHTYFVWYWDDPRKDINNYGEIAMEQNRIREKYFSLDSRTHKENQFARWELESGKIKPIDLSKFFAED